MALPTNAFATYESIGNREDLADVIYNVSPTETPILSSLERPKASAVNHEWQTDSLATADSGNAVLEGDDATTDAATPTVRLGNIAQISDKVARVTGTQEVINKAGRDSEMDYQRVKKGKELKIDMETILFGTNQAKASGSDGVARTLGSILSWIKTNTSKGVAGGAADPSTATGANTRTDGTQIAFTEARLKAAISAAWTSGGKPSALYCGAFNKQAFSTFTGRATPMEDTKAKKIIASVDVYESDFGSLTVTPCRNIRARDILGLQTDMWAVAFLRNMVTNDLAVTGDSRRKQILAEYTLEARNEKSSFGVFDNTTS